MAAPWGYSQQDGPHTWAAHYPAAAGLGQSPVDIVSGDAIYDQALAVTPLTVSCLPENNFTVENTGSSFKVNTAQMSEISGGPLKDRYRLVQFHLHWGSIDDLGSEHTINGKPTAAELHLVHWNCDKYSSFGEAVDKADGLAVLGVMIQVGNEHKGFEVITQTTHNVKQKGQKCQVSTDFDPACLLPENTSDYWTYHGSLTTPPCCESVQWIVFAQPVQYSSKQLETVRCLHDCEQGGQCIVDNYRPPLPLGDRKVRASFSSDIHL